MARGPCTGTGVMPSPCLLLSPLGAEQPCLAGGGGGVPPHTLRWVSSAAGKGGARAFCTSPTGQGRPPCKFWKTGRTPATGGCRQEAVLDAGEKPGTPVWQGPCPGPLPPSRSARPLQNEPGAARRPPSPPRFSRTCVWLRMAPQMEPHAVGRTALN